MKQAGLGGAAERRAVFPRIRAGASLKLLRPLPKRAGPPRFPPHSCGGLIEAALSRNPMNYCCGVFPRIRAGASLKQCCHCNTVNPLCQVFPRIRAGASLKQVCCHCNTVNPLVFPRIRAGASLKRYRWRQ